MQGVEILFLKLTNFLILIYFEQTEREACIEDNRFRHPTSTFCISIIDQKKMMK